VQPKKFRVIESYESPYPQSIFFTKGEEVEIGYEFNEDPDWKDWLWCKGSNSNSAWIPKQYLTIDGKQGTLKRSYDARELSVQLGEEVIARIDLNGFVLAEKMDGGVGWVPLKNLQAV
jgi:hypothetical protein